MLGDRSDPDGDPAERRDEMVDRLVRVGRISDDATEEAMRAVPRHEFVPEDRRGRAYADRPLPIGDGQTISAPHMVAIMTELLDLEPGDRVLEIGTGRGYHAAVTAEVVGAENVYTVEYSDRLAERARETLSELGYDVHVRAGDGREGWPEHAPYDAAYLTCAADSLPDAIREQVREGGRIVAPIGGRGGQTLYRYREREDGELDREAHGGVRFVPLR